MKGQADGKGNGWWKKEFMIIKVLWTAINAGIVVDMVSVISYFVIFPPPLSCLTWRVLKRAEISVFRWDYDHTDILHMVLLMRFWVFPVLETSISHLNKDKSGSWRNEEWVVLLSPSRSIICSSPLCFVSREIDIHELLPVYADFLDFDCIRQVK